MTRESIESAFRELEWQKLERMEFLYRKGTETQRAMEAARRRFSHVYWMTPAASET